MRPGATFVRSVLRFAVASAISSTICADAAAASKLDALLQRRTAGGGRSRVIVRATDDAPRGVVEATLRRLGGHATRALPIVNAHAGEVPDAALEALAASPWIAGVSADRLVAGTMERTADTVGATAVRGTLAYDGGGIGVAVIDSGIAASHADLTGSDGVSRVVRFVDFVNGRAEAYDDHGHGTHVAGIVAGSGFESGGARAGIAPGARLIVLKALDASGTGRVSSVIAALDYAVANRGALNIRVVNLSVRAGAYESYHSDPLTLAAQRAVRAGIVVTAAAGNLGRGTDGRMQYGGVTAPGNAPWVLTVGASNHGGTSDRSDDAVATFSSRGPGAGGFSAKPDIVAPGVGIESLSAPGSTLYSTRAQYLLDGTIATSSPPYLSMSGTSMSAPVAAGAVALMLQANPALTPNQVKAILQYTAEYRPGYDALTQGAGFLNAKGAVELARYFAAPYATVYPSSEGWSRRVVWGNRLLIGGRLTAEANAWSLAVTWGSTSTPSGKEPRIGSICSAADCGVTSARVPWVLSSSSQNVVWGSMCGVDNCSTNSWSPGAVFAAGDAVVWGVDADALAWGVNDDGVVWGLLEDGVVWGMGEDGVVWGLTCSDPSCEPVVWGGR
jgi:serine protease AprX